MYRNEKQATKKIAICYLQEDLLFHPSLWLSPEETIPQKPNYIFTNNLKPPQNDKITIIILGILLFIASFAT